MEHIFGQIICKECAQLNTKLFKVKIKLGKVIITFVDTVPKGLLNCFMPLSFVVFVSDDFTSNVTRRLSSGITFTFSKFLKNSCVSLTYEGMSLTMTYFLQICSMTVHRAYSWVISVTLCMYFRPQIKFMGSQIIFYGQRLFHLLIFDI